MTSIAIQARAFSVKKDSQEILQPFDLEVKSGAITGLIGPSGSGKTTLMRAIVGVQKYVGKLSVFDQSAGAKALRRRIGYVTQSPAVYGDLTVRQNIAYFAAMAGAKASMVSEVVRQVQLEEHADQLVGSLSGGQRARVSLAVALLGSPDLLILDEPTVGLDPILRNELWALFRQLAESGKTLLVSSHVMDEAERCDDLILVRDGAVLWNDTRSSLLKHTHTETVASAFEAMIEDAS